MREIEVKAKLRNEAEFLAKAQALGIEFGEPITQEDITYVNGVAYADPAWNIFRIRKQGEKTILTMKYKASDRSRDNHEREVEVSDGTEVEDMLKRVGYEYDVRIKKTRRLAHKDKLEICLDEVEGLGSFVEVEKLASDTANVDKIQAELWALLLELGISEGDRVHKGYDTLMHDHLKK